MLRAVFATLFVIGAQPGHALAAGGPSDTSRVADRAPLPARMVERPLQAPRGWTAVELSVQHWRRVDLWTDAGERSPSLPSRRLTVATLGIRHGLGDRVELFGRADLASLALDGSGAQRRPGDVVLGVRGSLLHRDAPLRSIAVHGALVGPPSFSDDAPQPGTVHLSAGTWAAALGLAARHQVGPTAVTGTLDATARTASEQAARRLVPDSAPGVRARPGGTLDLSLETATQIGPVALLAAARGGLVGATVETAQPEGSPIASADAVVAIQLGGLVSLTRTCDVSFLATWPLTGPASAIPALPLGHVASTALEGRLTGWF